MRAYDVSLFTFLFVLSLGMLRNINVFGTTVQVDSRWNYTSFQNSYGIMNSSLSGSAATVSASSSTADSIGMFISASRSFISMFVDSTVMVPEMFKTILSGFGLSSADAATIGYPIGVMVWFVYAVGIMQWWAGRNLEWQT